MSAAAKTCPGAHFRYFSSCLRCNYSEMIAVSDPWPHCEVCGDAMEVFAIGASLPKRPPGAVDDAAAAEFIERRTERFNEGNRQQ